MLLVFALNKHNNNAMAAAPASAITYQVIVANSTFGIEETVGLCKTKEQVLATMKAAREYISVLVHGASADIMLPVPDQRLETAMACTEGPFVTAHLVDVATGSVTSSVDVTNDMTKGA